MTNNIFLTERDTQRNKVLLNQLAQLIYSPNESTAKGIWRHLGIDPNLIAMSDKPAIVEALIRGLLDTSQHEMYK